jgi:Protein of unknown function (DUF4240)
VMDETEFWEIIDSARQDAGGDPEEQADLVVERLTGLDPDSVLDFARHFESRVARAFRWDVWGAAFVLLGGASDEAFDSFRCWLVGQGRHVFEGALHHPDDLATLLDTVRDGIEDDGEPLGYAADEAYEQLTGLTMPDLGMDTPLEPEGDAFDFDNDSAMRDRYPKLWERFGW